ncbi:MAG TPA: hypothetical protein VHE81_06685 [Lacipirellulaceae bacterium]|nr:hypothetical protein [Lacipirellulaceae bacterium]
MNVQDELEDYRIALHSEVCSRCIERRPGAPPCAPLGKGCGIERHLPALVELCRTTDSALIDPYVEKLHETICIDCEYKDEPECPCPLDYLLNLAIETVESVQRRKANRSQGDKSRNARSPRG